MDCMWNTRYTLLLSLKPEITNEGISWLSGNESHQIHTINIRLQLQLTSTANYFICSIAYFHSSMQLQGYSKAITQTAFGANKGRHLYNWTMRYDSVYCTVMISCLTFEGDVHSEEILFLSGLLPGEATWRLLLPYWGTNTSMAEKATVNIAP